ncbi:MAG: hypothetical protein OQL19_05310 [Gammaproteobacteria bacterium]|nr:hypothetical protein [Gammaproteobacteria bacterium]
MTWNLDTDELNEECEQIVGNLKEESLAAYCFINEQWNSGSIILNKLFQFVYRSFYRIDNAGLTDEFKEAYFQHMESTRNQEPNLYMLCESLHKIKNHKGLQSLQFSFVSKLANTVRPTMPIYDSEVAKMYGYRPLLSYKPIRDRINSYIDFYREMESDYSAIIEQKKLNTAFNQFDSKFPEYKDRINPSKKIDFIVWSAGKLRGK